MYGTQPWLEHIPDNLFSLEFIECFRQYIIGLVVEKVTFDEEAGRKQINNQNKNLKIINNLPMSFSLKQKVLNICVIGFLFLYIFSQLHTTTGFN